MTRFACTPGQLGLCDRHWDEGEWRGTVTWLVAAELPASASGGEGPLPEKGQALVASVLAALDSAEQVDFGVPYEVAGWDADEPGRWRRAVGEDGVIDAIFVEAVERLCGRDGEWVHVPAGTKEGTFAYVLEGKLVGIVAPRMAADDDRQLLEVAA